MTVGPREDDVGQVPSVEAGTSQPGPATDTADAPDVPSDAATDVDGASPADGAPTEGRSRLLTRTVPDWLFVVAVIATVPLVVFHFAADGWFLRDEWFLLTDQDGFPDLLAPNAGSHWVAVPRLVYWAFWRIWGITTYKPYLLANLALHLTAVVMIRTLLRRSGVRPWLATAGAAPLLLFGPGQEGIVLAFQVGFTGSIAWGLVQLVLADGEGGFRRRDLLALGAGVLAITSSGVGTTTTLMVGIALLLRRGWRMAALQTVPLGLAYGVWLLAKGESESPLGNPSASDLLAWDRSAVEGTISALSQVPVVAWAWAIVLVAATVLVVGPWRDRSWRELRHDLAIPFAMIVAAAFFATTAGWGRWFIGPEGAKASRYLYLQAAFSLPLLVVAAETVARRWRLLTPVLVVLLLAPIPLYLDEFEETYFGPAYYRHRQYILTTAVRMPFADDVPPEVRPVPDGFDSDGLTIGFLLEAERQGKLTPSTVEVTPFITNEFRVRLGFHQLAESPGPPPPGWACTTETSYELSPEVGDSLSLLGPVQVTTIDGPGGKPTSPAVPFRPDALANNVFRAELPDLHLRISPMAPGTTFQLCPLS